jgi:signal transduction histidine kinase
MSKPEERILLVDDNGFDLAILQQALSENFEVITARGGGAALDILSGRKDIAAIVANMQMPGMDGIELLREMHMHWPEVRRLMLTANTDQETAIAAANQGKVFRFFTKPCDVVQLSGALYDAIDEFRFATQDKKDRKILEIQAEAGERARRAFLSTMSHELLTPLNHVLGFSAILEEQWRKRGEREALEYLDHIRESGEALLRMVHRVLEIARMSSDNEPRKRELLEVTGIIGVEIDKMRSVAEKRSISLSFHAGPEPLYIDASEYEFRLALTELLDNAVKYNCKDGHVGVSLSSTEDEVMVRIVDTGIGIAGKDAEQALNAFCGKCGTKPCKGLGLGLTLVALFATAIGGKLSIDSGRSSGTAIMLSLKRVAQDIMAKPSCPAPEHPAKSA